MKARVQDGGRSTVEVRVVNREGKHSRGEKRESGRHERKGKGGGILGFARGLSNTVDTKEETLKRNSEANI